MGSQDPLSSSRTAAPPLPGDSGSPTALLEDPLRPRLAPIPPEICFEQSPAAQVVTDHTGLIVSCNLAATDLLELPRAATSGIGDHRLRNLVTEEGRVSFDRALEALDHDGTCNVETCLVRPDQSPCYVELTGRRYQHQSRAFNQFVLRDVSDRRRHEELLVQRAMRDGLTGLPNRGLLRDRLRTAFEGRSRRSRHFAVLFLDLDHFKDINDELGHLVGDRVLNLVARRLESCVRPHDTVARVYADEFVVLLDEVESREDALTVVGRIEGSLRLPLEIDGKELSLTASVGVFTSTDHEPRDIDGVLADADLAMLKAKHSGGGRVQLFYPELRSKSVNNLSLEVELRKALEKQEFTVHYQPLVDLRTGKIRELEALLRWQHPTRGLLFPADFLSRAEANGVIVPITDLVLEAVCEQVRSWRRESPRMRDIAVSINLSNRQFAESGIVSSLLAQIERGGLSASNLRIEITETALIEAPARETLERLREIGVSVSLDDFGTGYSSLSYLQQLDIDALKIDRSFVRRLGVTPEAFQIVTAIATLAHSLGMKVTAEGVEGATQLAALQQIGVDLGQGSYFAQPRSALRLTDVISREPFC